MRTQFHRFLLLLLMLVLPVQTFAAAAMLVCASAHQAGPAQMQMAADAAMAGCHEPEPLPQSTDCKHCTLCALASALPIPVADAARWGEPVPHFQPSSVVHFNGFIPAGPERPPRTPLA
ncbi:MAG: hypothetical protein AB1482_08925 [Pseudomonadota bacterium]